ncbi:MAG: thiamine pyrophosphate-dependent enzyme, partial [Acidimicrobiia bacterium]|nr:thiamine pyrophosphate-dependent enzyme [Acidimicrobiia bacterium]
VRPPRNRRRPRRYRTEEEEAAWRQQDPIDRFERYLQRRGLWDGSLEHDVAAQVATSVEAAIGEIESWPRPDRDDTIRHVFASIPADLAAQFSMAQSDEGAPAPEFDSEEIWHVGHDEVPDGPTERWTMAEAITAALRDAMTRRPNTLILGEDVAQVGGVFRITEGLMDEFGADRVIDTPLSESGIVGTAIGMAMAGARPVAEIQFDGFVYPAFDQIVSHLGRMRFRTRGNVSLPIVVRWPNGGGIGAHEFHGDSPETYFVHAPGLTVVMPSSPLDAKGLLAAALESTDPVIFLEPKVLYRSGREDVPVDYFTLPIGRARIRRPGDEVTLVTYGGMVPVCLAAAEQLAAAGVECEVIDLRTLFPWDSETVLASVRRTGRLVLVQEPPRTAGVAAEIAATVADEAIYELTAPIVRVTGFDAPWPQFAVETDGMISAARVVGAVQRMLTS